MSVTRISLDGLSVAARQLDHHADDIAGHRAPDEANPPNQATSAVVSATNAKVAAISAVLAGRIKAMAEKLDAASDRYAESDDLSPTALAE